MMFDLTVRYLGFLKHITLFAWLFDTMLMIWNLTFNRSLARSIEELEAMVASWEGVWVSLHKYGGRQFNYCDKEIGHVHSNGILDIRLSRSLKEAFITSGLAKEHHLFKNSGWISFYIRSKGDLVKAVKLLQTSMLELRSQSKGDKVFRISTEVANPCAMRWPSPRVKQG